jgi:hypothetical protein
MPDDAGQPLQRTQARQATEYTAERHAGKRRKMLCSILQDCRCVENRSWSGHQPTTPVTNVVTPSRPHRSKAPGHNAAPPPRTIAPMSIRDARFQPDRFGIMARRPDVHDFASIAQRTMEPVEGMRSAAGRRLA